MNYFRSIERQIQARLNEKSPLIQVVIGPRQVGKTTAIRQALNGRGIYESADSPTPLPPQIIEMWWEEAVKNPDKILAIDEIQKISGWSEVIKKKWDNDKSLKVILSGSAALSIEKELRESLAGRFELLRAEHWNYAEAKMLFSSTVKDFVEFGCYPGAERFKEDLSRWSAYVRDSIVEPAIGRDILSLHPVENPALLRQIFGFAIANPAQIISLHKLQGQLQSKGAVATVQHYLSLLAASFLVSGLQKYSGQTLRTKKSSPKIVIHDNALIRAFERQPVDPQRFGRYFENCVSARFIEAGWSTYYWTDRDHDVDLVVVGPKNQKWAIEVKSSHCDPHDLRGLKHFIRHFPEFSPVLISLVDQKIEGISTIQVEKILSLNSDTEDIGFMS
jgi:predicted AAA+ superfamily ATPase